MSNSKTLCKKSLSLSQGDKDNTVETPGSLGLFCRLVVTSDWWEFLILQARLNSVTLNVVNPYMCKIIIIFVNGLLKYYLSLMSDLL